MRLGRQQGDDLLAQLRELLLPSSSSAAPVKVESGGPTLGAGPPPPGSSSCDGRRRQRRRRGSKRGRDDDKTTSGSEQHEETPAAAQPPRHLSCKRSRKTKQQKSSSSLVTSEPDFDGYQWRKYGQKQIEGAMYARSYYRCTRSAEQGCPAKRTVQRNDDDGGGGTAPDPKYTVTYMGEHTCTADDSLEAPPVILETTAVVLASTTSTNKKSRPQDDAPTTSAGSCSTTTTGAGTESPAISDIARSSSGDHVDEYCGLFSVHDSWPSAAALQEMVEDFTGPIRSPVHIPAAGWTIDQLLLQLPDEPVCHFSF